MRRGGVVMLVLGGSTALLGVWSTAATPQARLGQGTIACLLLLAGLGLAVVRHPAQPAIETVAFGAIGAIGAIVPSSCSTWTTSSASTKADRLAAAPEPRVSTSAGVCVLGPEALTCDDLVARADKALYAAKAAGRARPVVWDHGAQIREPFAVSAVVG